MKTDLCTAKKLVKKLDKLPNTTFLELIGESRLQRNQTQLGIQRKTTPHPHPRKAGACGLPQLWQKTVEGDKGMKKSAEILKNC